MPVIAEALSVIVKDGSIRAKFIGGIDAFYKSIPNSTHCTDGKIHRIGFLTPDDNKQYIMFLERNGLTFIVDGKFVDIAVVDMQIGPTIKCPWIGFSKGKYFRGQTQWTRADDIFSIVWLQDENLTYAIPTNRNLQVEIALPAGWTPDDAIQINDFVITEDVEDTLNVLSEENGVKKVLNTKTGEIRYIGSPMPNEGDNTKIN